MHVLYHMMYSVDFVNGNSVKLISVWLVSPFIIHVINICTVNRVSGAHTRE